MTELPPLPDLDLASDVDRELEATDDLLASTLAQIRRAPADLGDKTRAGATDAMLSRSLVGTAADLMTVGWQTMRLLFAADASDPNDMTAATDPTTEEDLSC